MGVLFLFLIIFLIAPGIMILVGIVNLFNRDSDKKKKGRNLFLSGVLMILIGILIGYSVCSGLRIH